MKTDAEGDVVEATVGETSWVFTCPLVDAVIAAVRLLGPFWNGKLDRQPIYFEQDCGPSVVDPVGVPQFLSSCSNDFRQETQTVCTHLAVLN